MNYSIKKPVNIPVGKLKPFDENPYKVQDNDEMNSLITSIQDIGITAPILVRPIENTDEYEVISGHRRLHAAEKAGLETVPALIYTISRDEAAVMLVDSNLHREHILPSEKAFAYKLKMEALSHQGTSRQLGEKFLDVTVPPFSTCTQMPFRTAGCVHGADCCPQASRRLRHG